ncbi:MAG: hypothetical protein JO368_01795 [Acidimicrobiales bacterium]|nr:hypothetical protein [Acidimicrobiales bacterium]
MSTESDVEALKRAMGELASAVKELADAVKQGPFSDTATKRTAVAVAKTAKDIASQFASQDATAIEPAQIGPSDSLEPGAMTVPEDVIALVHAGKTLEALKRYRALHGATLEEAQAVIRDIT